MTDTKTRAPQAAEDNGHSPPAVAPPTNVIEALARVMAELPGIGRHERSEQGYSYRGIEAITREAQHLLGRYGVVFVPKVTRREVKDLVINGRPWTEDQAEIVYTVYGPGGVEDRIEIGPLIGLGRDNSDKGMNKAMTQAFKYALIQTLCIGDSKDDPDREEAHEADAPRSLDPEREARVEIAARIRGLSAEQRDRVRAFCDGESIPRVAAQFTDDQLEQVSDFVDGLLIADGQDRDAVEAQEHPEPDSAPSAANEAPEAHSDPQGATSEPPATAEPAEPPVSASSAKAKAAKRIAAAVTEMSDEQVTAMVAAYEHEPIEDLAGRRGQLIGLMLDEELAANG